MLAKKKKITKREIKEDQLVTTMYQIKDFYNENSSKILMVVLPIAIIIIGYILYTNKLENDNLEANLNLAKIMNVYETGNYQEAIDGQPGTDIIGLKAIIDNYGSSEQGNLAKIFLGNSYYFLENYNLAIEAYQSFNGTNELLKAAALAGQANCFEVNKEFDKAAKFYEDASNVTGLNPNNPKYLVRASIDYSKVGNNEKAEKLIQIINKEYATSQVARKLSRVKAQIGL